MGERGRRREGGEKKNVEENWIRGERGRRRRLRRRENKGRKRRIVMTEEGTGGA